MKIKFWEGDRLSVPTPYIQSYRDMNWTFPSGTPYDIETSRIVYPEYSSGTAYYPVATYYEGNPMINWTDFFSGRYKSVVFVKCAYCGNTKGKYEYNLLGHPVCVCCGAEIG